MWLCFHNHPDSALLCRPFIDFKSDNTSRILNFYSDVSLNKKLGMGAVFNDKWLCAQWLEKFIEREKPSIEFLELFALTSAIHTWGEDQLLNNTRVTVFCDNEAVVFMINNSASSCPQCMKLIRMLVMDNIKHNRRVFL